MMYYAFTMRFSLPSNARAINRLRILNIIATKDGLSRAQIARILGLNKVSTGEIVEGLIGDGLVVETGKVTTANGRRPVALSLVKDARSLLAIDIAPKATSFALADLSGTLLRFERSPNTLLAGESPEDALSRLIKGCRRLLDFIKNRQHPVGLAVSLAGSVDDEGCTVSIPSLGWTDVPLAALLKQHLDIDVVLVPRVTAMVAGEKWFSSVFSAPSVYYVNWDDGIDSAWVLDGVTASRGMSVSSLFTSTGTLAETASGMALSQRALSILGGDDLSLRVLLQKLPDIPALDGLMEHACVAMGEALATISCVSGCDTLVLGGALSGLPDSYFDIIQEKYAASSPQERTCVEIVRSPLADKAALMGAVASVLDLFMFRRSLLDQLDRQEK
ncbi:ROK family transcriptional regulator [Parasphaerochaeta coccoides]|nr:ROK family transcriptional regulator [Parasphaerochaeta coccoides]